MNVVAKMNQRREELKKNANKGFSLVELIIVIAIMAILVGIVGTQVVPYLEKSRKSKDIQVLSGWCTDAMTAYSSNAANLDSAQIYTITISATDCTATGGTTDEQDTLVKAFTELNDVQTSSGTNVANFGGFESKDGKDLITNNKSVTITCKNDNPMIVVHADGFDDIESK